MKFKNILKCYCILIVSFIAIQLDLMLLSTKELTEENGQMRDRDREMKLTVELHEKEKKMALNRSEVQSKVC